MPYRQPILTLALLAATAPAAHAQYTGVSHPDETIISTTEDPAPTYTAPRPTPPPSPPQQLENATLPTPTPTLVPRTFATAPANLQPPAQPDPNLGVVTTVDAPANAIPEGTLVKTRLQLPLSTKSTLQGSQWTAELTEPLRRDGTIFIPAGSIIHGRVAEVKSANHLGSRSALHLTPISITLPDGSSRAIHAEVIDTSLTHSTKIDQEGTILHRTNGKEETGVMALTVGSGAAAGSVFGGVPGALVGAGVGAGVSGVVWLKQDRQTILPAGTQITFELTKPLTYTTW